jgi:hypothetical protein
MKKFLFLIAMLTSVSLVGTGCDDSTKRRTGETVMVGTRDMDVPLSGTEMTDMMVEVPVNARELRVEGSRTRTIFSGDELDLQIRLVELRQTGEVALANQAITMKLLDSTGADRTQTGIQGTRLQSARINTNAQGLSTFKLYAGDPGVTVRLQATAADAAPVTITVAISQPASGDLTVRVLYDVQAGRYSYLDLDMARVSLFVNQTCDNLIADATRLSGADFSWAPITPFDDLNNTVTDRGFMHNASYTVAASVYSPTGRAVGFGCVEDVTVVGGEETEVMINAVDLPLEFKGTFITTNRFDLSDLLRSSQDPTLTNVADVLEILQLLGSDDSNRGSELIRLLCEVANIDMQACSIARAVGGPLIVVLLDQNIPPDVFAVLSVISDVLSIVTEMTIVGEIEFFDNYPDEENMLEGDNRWQRFRFNWRDGCMVQDCDRTFTIGNLDTDNRPIAGIFDSQVVEGSTLEIAEHGLNFRFGLIALGIAEQWIIPAVVGQQGPVALSALLGDLMSDVCIDVDQFLNRPDFCQNVIVNALSAIIIDQLGGFNFDPDEFRISGSATLVDSDTDLRIDQLQNGVWHGTINTDELNLSFNGCFTGCREAECPAPENECVIPAFVPEMDMMGMNSN